MFLKNLLGSLLLLLMIFTTAHAQITLHACTPDGRPLEKVLAGMPFKIELEIVGYQGVMGEPRVPGPHGNLHRTVYQMGAVNDKVFLRYGYETRIDEPGEYTFGPARVMTQQGSVEESNALQLSVILDSAEQHSTQEKRSSRRHNNEPVFARMTINKDRVVIGEPIEVTLKFYRASSNPYIEFHAVRELNYNQNLGLTIKNIKEPIAGKEVINDELYDYLEWKWDCIPNKQGALVIPASYFEYTVRSAQFYIFSLALGNATLHSLYSNPISLMVDPLPPYNGIVDGIGICEQLTASISLDHIRQEEGTTLTIELIGDIDLEQFTLKDIPSEFRLYNDNKKVIDYHGMKKYSFSYVLHAREAGSFIIPSQQFTFFDVKEHRYKTIYTDPLHIAVDALIEVNPSENNLNTEEDQSVLKPIIKSYGSPHASRMKIPHSLFFAIIIALSLWAIFPRIKTLILKLSGGRTGNIERLVITKRMHHALLCAEKKNEPMVVYSLYEQWFTRMMRGHAVGDVIVHAQERIAATLSPDEYNRWALFLRTMQEARFFYDEPNNISHAQFFKNAHYWVDRLKGIRW